MRNKVGIWYLVFGICLVAVGIPSVSAYIDPGTGGYLVSSLWSTVVGLFITVVSVLALFFRKFLITPVKNIWKKHKGIVISLIVASVVIGGAMFVWNIELNNS